MRVRCTAMVRSLGARVCLGPPEPVSDRLVVHVIRHTLRPYGGRPPSAPRDQTPGALAGRWLPPPTSVPPVATHTDTGLEPGYAWPTHGPVSHARRAAGGVGRGSQAGDRRRCG